MRLSVLLRANMSSPTCGASWPILVLKSPIIRHCWEEHNCDIMVDTFSLAWSSLSPLLLSELVGGRYILAMFSLLPSGRAMHRA